MSVGRRELLLLSVLVVACLLPFLGKAIHLDDPLFLWTARQIAVNPLDFYGFDLNWYGHVEPMYAVTKNPPLVSAYLALVGGALGWSEVALHAGMLLPALALALGTHALARHFCTRPLLAAVTAFAMPGVLVSATTLMLDVTMLALWVWGSVFFLRALESRRLRHGLAAGVLIGLCALAKYFGLVLIPLLALYALVRERRVGPWAIALAIPALLFGGYQAYMVSHYGWDALGDAARYAIALSESDPGYPVLRRTLVALSFAGGSFLTAGLFAVGLWSRRVLLPALGGIALAVALLWQGPEPALQLCLFAAVGVSLLALAALDLHARRDADALLLALWVFGTWVFAGFTNWTPTARAMLPMAPAVGILVARRLERRVRSGETEPTGGVRAPLIAGLALALAVAHGDARLAAASRSAAEDLVQRYGADGRLCFQGSWGFQHYMQAQGFERLDVDTAALVPGDRILTPLDFVSNPVAFPAGVVRTVAEHAYPAASWVATMRGGTAGFYAAIWGPLPYAFGAHPPQRYRVQEVVRPFRLGPPVPPAMQGRKAPLCSTRKQRPTPGGP